MRKKLVKKGKKLESQVALGAKEASVLRLALGLVERGERGEPVTREEMRQVVERIGCELRPLLLEVSPDEMLEMLGVMIVTRESHVPRDLVVELDAAWAALRLEDIARGVAVGRAESLQRALERVSAAQRAIRDHLAPIREDALPTRSPRRVAKDQPN